MIIPYSGYIFTSVFLTKENRFMNKHASSFGPELKNEVYASLWNHSSECFLLLANDATVVHCNTAAKNLLGLPENIENSTSSFYSLFVEKDILKIEKDIAYTLKNNSLIDCQYEAYKFDQTVFPADVSYKRLDFSKSDSSYILVIVKDITKIKIDERAMKKAKERAEVADRLKTSFLANMSHEIRTPINAVIGFADLLNDPDLEDDEKEEYINTIQVNGELLLKLINDIIDIAKIESQQLKIIKNEFSLETLLDEIYISTRNVLLAYDKPQLILEKYIDPQLQGKTLETDQFRLMQIINNLLSNAIKFTEVGTIEFGVNLLENGKPEFFVRDSGIGIDPADIDHIFERFGQVESSLELNVSGTGLGLSIVKSLVNLLGGNIKVQSKPGEGSVFTFTIDALSHDKVIKKRKENVVSLKGKKILIVEDTESNYRLINILLEKQGAETIWALSGNQGVSICKNSRDIDLVLMDINLPDIDGYQATAAIKAFRPNLPIVAQTAYAMAGEKEKSLEFGCDDYISKPIIPEILYTTLGSLLY